MELSRKETVRGSFTVEAAIIVPSVLFIIAVLIMASMLLAQKTLLSKAASLAAQQGAEIWVDSRKDFFNGAWAGSEERDPLYYRFFDGSFELKAMKMELNSAEDAGELTTNSLQKQKIKKLKEAIARSLHNPILKSKSTIVDVEYKNSILERKIIVVIQQEFKIPFGKLIGFFRGKDYITLSATGTAVVADPCEYIRDVDLIVEYASKVKGNSNFNDILTNLKAKIKP